MVVLFFHSHQMLQPPFRYQKTTGRARTGRVDGWTGANMVYTAYITPPYTPKVEHGHDLIDVIDLTEIDCGI